MFYYPFKPFHMNSITSIIKFINRIIPYCKVTLFTFYGSWTIVVGLPRKQCPSKFLPVCKFQELSFVTEN